MATSPTQRTLKALRAKGYTCEVTERWCQFSKRRKDLFGFIDILALKEGRIVGVQATSGDNTSSRIAKIKMEPKAQDFLNAGGKIIVIGWRKKVTKNKDGSKSKRPKWFPKVTRVRTLPKF